MASTLPPTAYNGTTYSFVPATTPWTANPSCSSIYLGTETDGTLQLSAFNVLGKMAIHPDPVCLPPAMTTEFYSSNPSTMYIMAPFTCPESWTEVSDAPYPWASSYSMTVCCPTGYEALIGGAMPSRPSCISSATGVLTYVHAFSTSSLLPPSEISTITTTLSSAQTVTVLAGFMAGLNTVPPSTTPPPDTSSLDTPSANSTPTSLSKSETSSSAGDSLSTGAQAGIGVGVSAGVILVIALVVLLYLRRRRQKQPAAAGTVGEGGGIGIGIVRSQYPRELECKSSLPQELDSKGDRAELEASKQQPLYELEATEKTPSHRSSTVDL